jgi:glycosyltransferase involved in cell wall biosynthesis
LSRVRALVFGLAPGDAWRFARTGRALATAGVAFEEMRSRVELIPRLQAAKTPLWLVRAGAWRASAAAIPNIPSSATGRPLIALGLTVAGGAAGDVYSCYAEPAAAHALAARMLRGEDWTRALRRIAGSRRFRTVRLPALDVRYDPGWRVLQLVTTIHIGGAERVTLDLAEELTRRGVAVCVAVFGGPSRLAFPTPPCFADLSHVPGTPEARGVAVAEVAREFGADIVHAHLIRGTEAAAIKAHRLPLVMTVHNMPPAWPPGLGDDTHRADLLLACSRAVAREIEKRELAVPVRVAWNGIAPLTPAPAETGAARRAALGWDTRDFVLVAVANPRRQKRLERLPEIVARLEETLAPRRVRLLLVGAPAEGSNDAQEALALLDTALDEWHVRDRVHWTGGVLDVVAWFAAADVFVSVSAFEGLSLAQLEALAAGLPVVATNVGGTSEVARQTDRVTLLPPNANAADFVRALAVLATAPPSRKPALPVAFTRYRMAARVRGLYPAALLRARRGDTVWLITNNFSTGGAQSSARRLLTGFAARGIKVRAVTVEEWPEHPTAGRRALSAAGVEIIAIPPPRQGDAAEAVDEILTAMMAAPPRAVFFWNLIASYKLILADLLLAVPIFDVSPGEMFFASLDQVFRSSRQPVPCENAREYGSRLAGVVVKYHAEAANAVEALGAPVSVIRNGVPLPPLAPHRTGKQIIIGTASRLAPDKHLEQLLAALRLAHSRLPHYRVRIAGGAERGHDAHARELRRLARGLPVEWCGEVADTAALLAGLDVFAMISEPAGCPNASLEAMAAGLPVIATDHGGASEQVIDGLTGRLVPRGDTHAIAEALVELTHDAEKRARFGEAARERIRTEFSIERMIDGYAALLESANAIET